MSRLDNIIARNRRGGRPRERVITSLVFGGIILLILGLMVFTDLGAPPPDPSLDGEPAATAPRARRGPHADGVLLRHQPAAPSKPSPAPATPAPTK